MDEIKMIKDFAEKAGRASTPHVSISGKIDYASLDKQALKKKTFMYLAIGSAAAAAVILILLLCAPAGSAATSAESVADMHNFFSYFYPSF